MFALLQNHATGMPALDAEADFRRARRRHAVALIAGWFTRRPDCRHPIALAHRRGDALPPIELVKRPEGYYVLDGRHRVSVAQALGHPDIARVTGGSVSG